MANPSVAGTSIHLPERRADSHKGTYGRVLIIAGSRGMSGAAVLAGSAALRGGAGLARIAVPAGIQPVVAAGNPCYMSEGFPEDPNGRFAIDALNGLLRASEWADVVAIGPGLGESAAVSYLVSTICRRCTKPIVLDADGLNAIADLPTDAWRNAAVPLIMTPHPGEFGRLTSTRNSNVQSDRLGSAQAAALKFSAVMVLKGYQSLVTDGRKVYQNDSGNPGMATGGTGDVLTGLIAALVGQGLPAIEAAALGVWVHGRAGDLAADALGQTSLIASDLLSYLPAALREIGG